MYVWLINDCPIEQPKSTRIELTFALIMTKDDLKDLNLTPTTSLWAEMDEILKKTLT